MLYVSSSIYVSAQGEGGKTRNFETKRHICRGDFIFVHLRRVSVD